MKCIVMFTNTYHPLVGGLERSVANAHQDLNESGHFCRVVTPAFKEAEESCGGVLRVPALKGLGEREFSIPLPTTGRIRNWMEAIEPDVLHSHQPFLLGETAWRVSRLRGVPLVFTHHTLYERYAHLLPMEEDSAKAIVTELASQYANRCHMVIAPTASIRDLLIERGVETPIEIAPSGIDWSHYSNGSRERGRAALGLSMQDEVVGHLGRLSQEKNIAYLVEAISTFMKARQAAKFLLVGNGDRLAWARERFEKEGLGDRVLTPGVLSNHLPDAYAAMDVFVFASLTDTQGLVLAEAMAAGLPIVALDAPGARDLLCERWGLLLPERATPNEFAEAVRNLLAHRRRLQYLGTAAREAAREYDRAKCIQRLLAVYERACAEYRPKGELPSDHWDQLAQRFDVEWTPFWEKITTTFRAASMKIASASSPRSQS